jgi:predicted RNA-binding Zn-ribbon protein involved in translation (DUF1610 family)
MEKLGVDTENPEVNEKTAAKKKDKCPSCNSQLEDPEKTGHPKCPVHGTEPFEK